MSWSAFFLIVGVILTIASWIVVAALISRTAQLRRTTQELKSVLAAINDFVSIHAADGSFLDVNPRGSDLFGYTRDEFLARKLADLSSGIAPYNMEGIEPLLQKAISGDSQTFEWHCKSKDGRLFWIEVSLRSTTPFGRTILVSVVRDITERKRAEATIVRLARSDALTGLPNRAVFVEALEGAILRAQRGGGKFAVLYLDLDHFKDVNDTQGHAAGDALLQAVATRLQQRTCGSDTVARFGGDEFAILQNEVASAAEPTLLAGDLLEILGKPITVGDYLIHTGASIGIAIYGEDAPDPETVLAHADVALYRAKSEGRFTFRVFTPGALTAVR
jgi:diguanylate cyclase (GGDEF)-like protein/PAS domain S-box-containing protein